MINISTSEKTLQEKEKAEFDKANRPSMVLSSLASYVGKAFTDAELHRQTTGITDRLLKSRRQKSGKYDPEKLVYIRKQGGSDTFHNITGTKCDAFEAWMEDVFSPSGDRAWDAVPTPIPTLPYSIAQNVVDYTVANFSGNLNASPQEVHEFAVKLYDETLKAAIDDAKKRCDRMVQKMEDQTIEGGFYEAFSQFIVDMGTYPTAILKGPIFVRKKQLKWKDVEQGRKNISVEEVIIPTWECVDPFNFYPGPNCRHVNESYLCQIIDFDASRLSEFRGVDGWSTNAINNVLSLRMRGGPNFLVGESENADLENRNLNTNGGLPDDTIRAIEFWGATPGSMLIEWGMKGIDDPNKYYEVNCILVGDQIIRAILNPDPLDRRPYYCSSFVRNKNSIWGLNSIPEKMEDCQDAVNSTLRSLTNNMALGSGPQVSVDVDAIPANHKESIYDMNPWKVWPYNGRQTKQDQPVRFFQPQIMANELIQVAEYFEQKADDRTLIPRYVYGNENLKGAGSTASGLSMLINSSNRGFKRVIKNIDRDILRPVIERLYTWNMIYLEDESLKGDVQIVPRGALAILVKEQTQLRRQEFLGLLNAPIAQQIVGVSGYANVLREIAKGLDIPVDKVIPSEEELIKREQEMYQQQVAQQQIQQEAEMTKYKDKYKDSSNDAQGTA